MAKLYASIKFMFHSVVKMLIYAFPLHELYDVNFLRHTLVKILL